MHHALSYGCAVLQANSPCIPTEADGAHVLKAFYTTWHRDVTSLVSKYWSTLPRAQRDAKDKELEVIIDVGARMVHACSAGCTARPRHGMP